jgi:hypothetical protein
VPGRLVLVTVVEFGIVAALWFPVEHRPEWIEVEVRGWRVGVERALVGRDYDGGQGEA